jgi:isopentenyl-diphosphate Delta-isomerase
MQQDDPAAEQRKSDHITLALKSRVEQDALDARFDYEPLFQAHPTTATIPRIFLGHRFDLPIWVSSMTGGTAKAGIINRNLARACRQFGMGMGIGSCRQLLFSHDHLADFAMRDLIGDQPMYANLGIAQLELLFEQGAQSRIDELLAALDADGLIIHINPLQEAMQPEGDMYKKPALETIQRVIDHVKRPLIVKEVGQGMGPRSMATLMQLPLAAIEFAAGGGTNFALLELLRADQLSLQTLSPMAKTGHSAAQMVEMTNTIAADLGNRVLVKELIISGGITHWLDGWQLTKQSHIPAIYGQASAFLPHAQGDYEVLEQAISLQARGLALAEAFLVSRK